MKKHLVFLVILTFANQIKSHAFENIIEKFALFYASQFTATLSHELGHALISNYRNFNPKIIIGKAEGKHDKKDPFIKIDPSYDPNCGVTISDNKNNKEDRETKQNRSILQGVMGPTFGIISRIAQLLLIDCFQNKLGNNLSNSLRDFISAKIIAQLIYGFTPFDQLSGGDGAKLFNMLHIKYKFKTKFFENAKSYQQPFSTLKNYGAQLIIGYYLIYFLSKLINKNDMLDKIDENFNSNLIQSICGYLKDNEAKTQLTIFKHGVEETYKKQRNEEKKVDNIWIHQLISECFIF